jgi:hypothetical protein
VSQTTDARRLATLRAVGILCGFGSFVLHNGAGVTGRVDPAHNRPANLWEVPGIDDVMHVVRDVEMLLPKGLEDWTKGNQHGGTAFPGFENLGQVLAADGIWSDGHDHGASRCYVGKSGDRYVQIVYGVKGYVEMVAQRRCSVESIVEVVDGPFTPWPSTLEVGQAVRLPGGANGSSDRAYILQGRML